MMKREEAKKVLEMAEAIMQLSDDSTANVLDELEGFGVIDKKEKKMDADKVQWDDENGNTVMAVKLIDYDVDCGVLSVALNQIANNNGTPTKIIASRLNDARICELFMDRMESRMSPGDKPERYMHWRREEIQISIDTRCGDRIYIVYEDHGEVRAPEFAHLDELP